MSIKLVSVFLRVSLVIALVGILAIRAVAEGPGQVPYPPIARGQMVQR